MIAALAGGVGAARFLRGLLDVVSPTDVTAIVNTGDDLVLHGLHISPDLDTVTYTLAGAINPELGWGLKGETWTAMAALDRYGGQTWFRLGDQDLATHMFRTQRLSEGAALSTVTAEIAQAWGLTLRLLPVTDDPIATRVTVAEGEISFQDYFVGRQHQVAVSDVRFAGAGEAEPAAGVLAAIHESDAVVVCPSNPIVSIGPLLAVRGLRDALERARERSVAISPIVAGAALKGPADRMLSELGHEASVVGVARLYAPLAAVLVIDQADAELAPLVEAEGMKCVVTDTIMRDALVSAALATTALAAVGVKVN